MVPARAKRAPSPRRDWKDRLQRSRAVPQLLCRLGSDLRTADLWLDPGMAAAVPRGRRRSPTMCLCGMFQMGHNRPRALDDIAFEIFADVAAREVVDWSAQMVGLGLKLLGGISTNFSFRLDALLGLLSPQPLPISTLALSAAHRLFAYRPSLPACCPSPISSRLPCDGME